MYGTFIAISQCIFRDQSKAGVHKKSVKIGAGLFLVSMASFTPLLVALNTDLVLPGHLMYFMYINNFANFFVYIWIDRKFRAFVLCSSNQSN